MQAMGRAQQQGSGAARTFPPSQLEWTAAQEKAGMALDVGCLNGDQFSCPVHSWSTGEEVAGDILRHRGLTDGWRGWTVAMKNGVQWAELAGHDYVLDLVSDLELLRDFPRQKSYFIVGCSGTAGTRTRRRLLGSSPRGMCPKWLTLMGTAVTRRMVQMGRLRPREGQRPTKTRTALESPLCPTRGWTATWTASSALCCPMGMR